MQDYTEIQFKWLGKSVPCPDENLQSKNYEFYSECEIDNIKYEVGIGAVVRVETKPHIGVIHYFYEIPHPLPKGNKFVVAIELFHKPKNIKKDLDKPIQLDNDLEVVKKDRVTLIHVPVYAIKSRCVVVYGLKDEDPHELLHEFMSTTKDTIYVCRYIASFKRGVYYLKGAIYNEDEKNKTNDSIDKSDEESPYKHLSAGNFSVSIVENLAHTIKIKLRRALSTGEENQNDDQGSSKKRRHVPRILARNSPRPQKKTQQSPSELLKNLTITPRKRRERPSLEIVENINKNIKQQFSSVETTDVVEQIKEEFPSLEQIENYDQDIKLELPDLEIIDRQDFDSDSSDEYTIDESLQPIVVLNRIEMNTRSSSVKKSARIESLQKDNDKSTRTSKRQSARISYAEFYEMDSSPEKRSTRSRISKSFNDYVVSIPRSTRKQNEDTRKKSSVTFDETATPKKKTEENTYIKTRRNSTIEEQQKTVENTPRSTKKVIFANAEKNQVLELEETHSVRQKRSVVSPVDETPKKQSRIMNTPKSGRLNIMTMTPTIEEREEPIVFCNTPMSRARLGLSAYSVPSKMPCRENEYKNIYSFVTGRLTDQSSGCMYISGVPGTGKTMTVCRVMSDLSDQKEDYPDFEFLKLNALALTEPRQIYVEIVKKLLNKKLHWQESLKEMERFFKAKKKKCAHVILIDELDKLCNRKQDVVYNLLDLPFHSVTPLIVITIANTMDLPERILTNKVNSRLGLVRLTFKPYQYKDLVKIVTERLATDAVFKNEALELVARKVAAVSGDARRALAMCSRATEIAEEEDKDLVSMDVVDRVIKEMSSSSKVQAIQSCSKLEQLVLSAIANEVTRTGNEEVPFLNMLHNLEQLCLLESFKLPSAEVCLRSCHNLGSFRLLITQHGRTDINMTLMLNISTDDVHYALRP